MLIIRNLFVKYKILLFIYFNIKYENYPKILKNKMLYFSGLKVPLTSGIEDDISSVVARSEARISDPGSFSS